VPEADLRNVFEADIDARLQHLGTVKRDDGAAVKLLGNSHASGERGAGLSDEPIDAAIDRRSNRHPVEAELHFGNGDLSLFQTRDGGIDLRLGFVAGSNLVGQK
jgi:hypothetical protein